MVDKAVSDLSEATTVAADDLVEIETVGGNSRYAKRSNLLGVECLIVAVSDETTALTAGTTKVKFRMPYLFTLTDVRAALNTAQTSGAIFTVDLNEAGVSVLSTKLTIDNTETTSTTAATAPVISDASIADFAEMTVDIDQIGDGTAKGLKLYMYGKRP